VYIYILSPSTQLSIHVLLYFLIGPLQQWSFALEPCKASRSASVFCGLTIHLSLTLKSVDRYEGVHGYQQRTEMLMILKSTKPTPKKLKRTRVLQEHLKAFTSIYAHTLPIWASICVYRIQRTVLIIPRRPHPKTWKSGYFTVGDSLNVTQGGWSLWLVLEICTSSKIVCRGHYFTKVGTDALRATPPMLSMLPCITIPYIQDWWFSFSQPHPLNWELGLQKVGDF